MDVLQDAIIIASKLVALNLPGGVELLDVYSAMDHTVVRTIVRDTLAEVYCSYPATFPVRGTLVKDPTTGMAAISIRDYGYYGSVAANVLTRSEVAMEDRGKVSVVPYSGTSGAKIPLDMPVEGMGHVLGTTVTFFVHPDSPLLVTEATELPSDHSSVGGFVPLLVYALPVFNLDPPLPSKYSPHIPLAVAGWLRGPDDGRTVD